MGGCGQAIIMVAAARRRQWRKRFARLTAPQRGRIVYTRGRSFMQAASVSACMSVRASIRGRRMHAALQHARLHNIYSPARSACSQLNTAYVPGPTVYAPRPPQ